MNFKKYLTKENLMKVLYFVVLFSFILPVVFLSIRLAGAPTVDDDFRDKSDYVLMIAECVLGVIVINIPSFLAKKLKFDFPVMLNLMYLIFLYCAITLGEVRSFYYRVPHWDMILHCFSSMMLGTFGFMFVSIINKDEKTTMRLSPLFVSLFAFGFAVSIGVLWEIYEFSFDAILGLNMQKFRLEDGTMLVGREALSDTMEDLIIDALGAFAATLLGFFSLKKKRRSTLLEAEPNPDAAQKTAKDEAHQAHEGGQNL